MPTGREVLATADTAQGKRYRLGAEAGHDTNDPAEAFDCSELVEWAHALNGVTIPDGTVYQYPFLAEHGVRLSVAEARTIPGALLFVWAGSQAGGGRGNHVGFARGDGSTMEARSTRAGVRIFGPHEQVRWTDAFLHPDVDYAPPPPPVPAPTPPELEEMHDMIRLIVKDDPAGAIYAFSPTTLGIVWIADGNAAELCRRLAERDEIVSAEELRGLAFSFPHYGPAPTVGSTAGAW